MTVNNADLWLIVVPSLILALALWVLEFRRLLGDVSVLGVLICLISGVAWTALLFAVAMVLSAITSGIYCEDCSTRPANAGVLVIGFGYLLMVLALLAWAIGRIRVGPKKPPGPELSPEQEAIAAALDAEQVARIDQALVAQAGTRGRKVAMIVAMVVADSRLRVPGLPELYYARRVKELVRQGRLVAEGEPASVEHSEVRLP